MAKVILIALVICSVAIGSVPALAIPTHCPAGTPSPNAAVLFVCGQIGSDNFFAPLVLGSDGKTYRTPPGFERRSTGNSETPWRIALSVLLDPDPSISYSILAENSALVPQDFHFSFLEAIVPEGYPTQVRGRVSGVLTDSAGNGLTLTPLAPPSGVPADSDGILELAVSTLSSDTTATPTNFTSKGVDVGPSISIVGSLLPGDTSFYGPFDTGLVGGPDPGAGNLWRWFQVDVGFTLSAGDTAQLSGFSNVNAVPEPGTLLLLGLGLVGLGFVSTRSRNRSR